MRVRGSESPQQLRTMVRSSTVVPPDQVRSVGLASPAGREVLSPACLIVHSHAAAAPTAGQDDASVFVLPNNAVPRQLLALLGTR